MIIRSSCILLLFLFTNFVQAAAFNEGVVAYLAHSKGYWQVWTMAADGTNQKQITTSPFDKNHISWYPDGRHILVNGVQGELYKVNTISKTSTIISLPIKGTQDAVISPHGKKIAFSLSVAGSVDNNHIWIADSDGKNLTKLTNRPGLQHEPVWSRDGKWIYFLSKGNEQSHDIWRVSAVNKSLEQLTAGQLFHFDIALSKSNKVAFSSNRTGHYDIWVRTDGKDTNLTNSPTFEGHPTWSENEKELIIESSRDGVLNLWRLNLKGANEPVQLTHYAIGARHPVWWHHSRRTKS